MEISVLLISILVLTIINIFFVQCRYSLSKINNNDLQEIENKSKHELFEEFFELQNNQKMNDKQRKIIDDLINKIWG